MLKAYVDDSHTPESAFVLAGYIAPVENWAAFCDEWQGLLDMKPPLAFFKMKLAHGTWGERRWTEQLPLFYAAIDNHVSAGISLLIPRQEYQRVFGSKRHAENPYNLALPLIIRQLTEYQHKLNLTGPVDFIFDEGNGEKIVTAWDGFVASAPPATQKLLGARPSFGDDKKMKPLQAADLLAWCRRRKYETKMNPSRRTRPLPWVKKRELRYLDLELPNENIQVAYDMIFGPDGSLLSS